MNVKNRYNVNTFSNKEEQLIKKEEQQTIKEQQPIKKEQQQNLKSHNQPNCIKFVSLNCQSIRNKTQNILSYITDNEIDVACFQETWINKGDECVISEMQEQGFKMHMFCRGTSGGGVAIVYRPWLKLNIQRCGSIKFSSFEFVFCVLQTKLCKVNIVNIYRLPYSNKHKCTPKMFLDDFERLLEVLLDHPGILLIVGDFNIHMEDSNHYTTTFLSLLESNNLAQFVTRPTHIKGGIIDLVILDKATSLKELCVDYSFVTDHYPITFSLNITMQDRGKTEKRTVRQFYKFNLDRFIDDVKLSELTNSNVFGTLSCTEALDMYNNTLRKLYDFHCPKKEKVIYTGVTKPKWFNESLLLKKRQKRAAERKYKKHKNNESLEMYRKLRNEYNQESTQARNKYYELSIENAQSDPKKLYKSLNDLTGNKHDRVLPSVNTSEMTNEFSKFYKGKVIKIREEIEAKNKISTSSFNTATNSQTVE